MAYSPLQLALRYLQFWFTASPRRGHGVHSPFVYAFVEDVLTDTKSYDDFRDIERLRRQLLEGKEFIPVADWGAGSSYGSSADRRVSDIARRAAKSPRLAQLLYRIARYFQPQHILELGTSLGISTAYLAKGCPSARVITIEGSPAVRQKAVNNLEKLQLARVECLEGQFDDLLPGLLQHLPVVDLSYIDGNHRKEPTLKYFHWLLQHRDSHSLIIFDDIHWSREMEEAWEIICQSPEVRLTIDLFHFGLVFFREEFVEKQHFNIRI